MCVFEKSRVAQVVVYSKSSKRDPVNLKQTYFLYQTISKMWPARVVVVLWSCAVVRGRKRGCRKERNVSNFSETEMYNGSSSRLLVVLDSPVRNGVKKE